MINFAIPGLYELNELNFNFLKYKRENPHKFYNDVNINAVYGNFQFCVWDGGRNFPSYSQASFEEMQRIINTYTNEFDVDIRLVFTNNQLKETDYYNRFGNLCLTLCENERNEVVVGDDKFKEYIKENYPKYKIISSTTKCLNKEELLKEFDKDYNLICLDYNLNSNIDLLKTFNKDQKEKTEFLVNAICPPGCPYRRQHYIANSLYHLSYGKAYHMDCKIKSGILSKETMEYKNNLSYQKIKDIYYPLGFKYFKLEGRTLPATSVLGLYLYYMVKPEYHLEILEEFRDIITK